MHKAFFEYKGINSLDMHLKILNDISFPSPESDIEFIEVAGKDGELAISKDRLKSIDFSIPVHLHLPKKIDVAYMSGKISEWLKTDVDWHPFKFSGLKDYEYQAICYEQFDIQETLANFGKTVITFKLKPIRKLSDDNLREILNGQSIINPGKRPGKPLIYIEGSGPITLKNNGVDWLKLNSIDGNITIDSELMTVYKGNSSHFHKMLSTLRPLFPILNHKENVITWTGNITKLVIDPRWSVIV